jgi:hypothetical protein
VYGCLAIVATLVVLGRAFRAQILVFEDHARVKCPAIARCSAHLAEAPRSAMSGWAPTIAMPSARSAQDARLYLRRRDGRAIPRASTDELEQAILALRRGEIGLTSTYDRPRGAVSAVDRARCDAIHAIHAITPTPTAPDRGAGAALADCLAPAHNSPSRPIAIAPCSRATSPPLAATEQPLGWALHARSSVARAGNGECGRRKQPLRAGR